MELEGQYDAKKIEDKIYKLWEDSGFFNPDNLDKKHKKPFTILMPPANANGNLHAGHALVITIEDIMTRYKRMQGFKTLWLPGLDHAGFETQVVYEKKLEKEGRSRFKMAPEELYQEILQFTLENKKNIEGQIKKLGASCDWSREKFTLDADIVKTVYETFDKLKKDNLVYRGRKIINWCSKHQTSLSDLETLDVEQADKLYYLKYGPFVIATARPETKFGDKYVVMHPKDKRYAKYQNGEKLSLEWINGPIEATVVKDEAIDMEFGTGAMTITPWHDAVDFGIAEKHKLDKEQVIDFYGKLLPIAGEFTGMKTGEARAKIVEKLQAKGLVEKIEENYKHAVKTCYKCNSLIEPQVKEQWFLKMKPLAAPAIKAIESGKITFIPAHYKKISLHWLKNILDWPLSRQIIWGIKIPAWFKDKPKVRDEKTWEMKIYGRDIFDGIVNGTKKIETRAGRPRGEGKYWGDFKPGDTVVFSLANEKNDNVISSVLPVQKSVKKVSHFATIEEMFKKYEPGDDYPGKTAAQIKKWWKQRPDLHTRIQRYGIWALELTEVKEQEVYIGTTPPNIEDWQQDSDVFDTWFSSGQWPFATLRAGQPKDFKTFYPTDVMETAGEIIFFWVARMIMLGIYTTGKVPFKTVYLHGLVLDAKGQKMSKSKGNVINPMEITDKYGTDALRIGLVMGNTPGQSLALDENKIKGYRNFANKIWNAAKFVQMNVADSDTKAKIKLPAAHKKNLKELQILKKEITKLMDDFKFYIAAEKIYHYFWHTFCDKIIEESKVQLADTKTKQATQYMLLEILTESLKILHPFMPFITEEIWQQLNMQSLLMVEQWPT